MTGETLKKANELVDKLAQLKIHRQRIMEYTDDLKKISISVEKSSNVNYTERLQPELFVIAADRQMQFYIDELDKKRAQMEAELASL